MVQGTTSDAGKTVLVAGLCRFLARKGISVAPFKPQNMALNSAVTADGGEIGRAQALQAEACGIDISTDMNPVLLKPNSDTGSQVIVHGKAVANMEASNYHQYKNIAMQAVLDSAMRLQQCHQQLLVEGAGSPAEINLRDRDIANMGFAEAIDCPVILVADIDRGGVFAHLVGTLELLSESEQQRVIGFVINRFRGDIALLQPGLDWLEQRTGKPVIGVLPYLKELYLDAEDAVVTQQRVSTTKRLLQIAVPQLSRISNHTDFDALRQHPDVNIQFYPLDCLPEQADLVILPGSKNTCHDLALLRQHGWPQFLQRHLRYGGKLMGICGGYQMLGQHISDPNGVESKAGQPSRMQGLGWLNMQTELLPEKTLKQTQGVLCLNDVEVPIRGYEIHAGVSKVFEQPLIRLSDSACDAIKPDKEAFDSSQFDSSQFDSAQFDSAQFDGARTTDGQILGTYLHGLFDHPEACQQLLRWAGLEDAEGIDMRQKRDQQLNRLSDAIEKHLNMDVLFSHLTL